MTDGSKQDKQILMMICAPINIHGTSNVTPSRPWNAGSPNQMWAIVGQMGPCILNVCLLLGVV